MPRLPYFDKPDNEECFQKMLYTVRMAGTAGVFVTWIDIMMISKPNTNFEKLERAARCMLPFVAMGATGAAIACSMANIRGKNDLLNYAIGGFAGGSIWGVAYKSLPVGVAVGMATALGCTLLKLAHRDNWAALGPNISHNATYGTLGFYRRDYSIRKEPKDYPKEV